MNASVNTKKPKISLFSYGLVSYKNCDEIRINRFCAVCQEEFLRPARIVPQGELNLIKKIQSLPFFE